jgi:hypothetical protein
MFDAEIHPRQRDAEFGGVRANRGQRSSCSKRRERYVVSLAPSHEFADNFGCRRLDDYACASTLGACGRPHAIGPCYFGRSAFD